MNPKNKAPTSTGVSTGGTQPSSGKPGTNDGRSTDGTNPKQPAPSGTAIAGTSENKAVQKGQPGAQKPADRGAADVRKTGAPSSTAEANTSQKDATASKHSSEPPAKTKDAGQKADVQSMDNESPAAARSQKADQKSAVEQAKVADKNLPSGSNGVTGSQQGADKQKVDGHDHDGEDAATNPPASGKSEPKGNKPTVEVPAAQRQGQQSGAPNSNHTHQKNR